MDRCPENSGENPFFVSITKERPVVKETVPRSPITKANFRCRQAPGALVKEFAESPAAHTVYTGEAIFASPDCGAYHLSLSLCYSRVYEQRIMRGMWQLALIVLAVFVYETCERLIKSRKA